MKKLYLALSFLIVFTVNNLYKAQSEIWGMNPSGGNGLGSIYSLPTGSAGIGSQYTFTGSPGANPQYTRLLEVSGGKLYGMTNAGGLNNLGVIFEYDTTTNNYVKKIDLTSINGSNPNGSLMMASNGKLYGMTRTGGANGFGVIFEYEISSNTYTKKIDFTGTTGAAMGAQPYGSLIETAPSSGKLLGMTRLGGANNLGVIFEYDYNTNTYTKKVDFTGTTGAAAGSLPYGNLTKAGANFYGMTSSGGANATTGVIFEYDYTNDVYTKKIDLASGTGSNPQGSMFLVGSTLYGMTILGGAAGSPAGVIFQYDYGTNTYTKLVDFSSGVGSGANPTGDIIQATNGKLYGMTRLGGANNQGAIFEYDLTGPTYTKKIDLATTALVGGQPIGSLIQVSTGKIYGMTSVGGSLGVGVIFQYNIGTNAYAKKIDFNLSVGGNPNGQLVQASNGKLYGMAATGGTSNLGVIFEYDKTTSTYTKKIDLTSTTGNTPYGGLIEASNGKLYGLTSSGGTSSFGTLFDYDASTNTFTKRVDFNGASLGAVPYGSLVQYTTTGNSATGKLYGLTRQGGTNSQGVIFEFDPGTNTYTKKIDMVAATGGSVYGTLIEVSGKLYGLTSSGGANSLGALFEYDPVTNTYTDKIDFTGTTGAAQGSSAFGSLAYTPTVGIVYGMTRSGGTNDLGVIFEYNVSTNTYTKKYDMTSGNGSMPLGSLVKAANDKLYGVTNAGGTNSSGVLFEYDIATSTYTKKIDFSFSTTNFPTYTRLLEVCTKPLTPGSITSSTNALCFGDAAAKTFSIAAVSNATSYAWSLPAGASITSGSTGVNITTDLSGVAAGTYSFGVAGVNICGTGTLSVNSITVNALPTITVNSGPVCAGSVFTIIPGGATSYSVQGGFFQVSPSGNTTYTVVGYSSVGCASSNTPAAAVTVNSLPTIGVNSGTICQGNSFTMVATGVITSTPSGGSLVVSPATSTFYTIVGTDANGCLSSNTATSNVTVNALPVLSINNATMCAGNSVTLSPTGAGAGGTYTMGALSGAGPFVFSPSSSTTFSAAGSTSFGCVSSNTPVASVVVYTLPVLTVNSPTMCFGQSAVISPSGAGASGTYTVGTSNGPGPFTVSPSSTTNYNVSGTSSLGCVSSNTPVSAVTVYTLPVISVASGTICAGSSYTFVPSGAASYTMTGPVVGTSFPVSPAVSTSYTFAGTSALGCVSAFPPATGNVVVYALPTLSVNSGTVCLGSTFTIIPSGGTNYTIQPINIITANSATVTPSSNSAYMVTGQNSLGCVSLPATSNVTVIALPVITTTDGAICLGDVFTTTVNGAASYTYAGPGSTVISGGSATLNPVATTSYSIFGTSPVGCISTVPSVLTVTVNPLPQVFISSNPGSAVCAGESATLTASGANTYNWGTSTGSTVVVTPAATGNFSVTGTDLNGCSTQTFFPLIVNPLPTVSLISGAICPGNCYTLTPSGAFTYTFTNATSAVVCPSVTTDYTVAGTSTAGCVSSQSAVATVSVVNILTVTISGNTTICLGGTANLTANGASSYSWNTSAATNTIGVSPTTNTSYTVVGSSGSCSDTSEVLVTVNPLPNVAAIAQRTLICVNESVELTTNGAVSYSWSTSSTSQTITVSPTVTTTYTVLGTDSNFCSQTASVTISVDPCLGINNSNIETRQFLVYPNPNSGAFVIETSTAVTAVILNALGQTVLKQQLTEGKNQIDLNEQTKGIYFIQIKDGSATKTIKIVKQ